MARYFRSDDTSIWTEQFGTGKDGSVTVSTTVDFNVNNSPFTTNANAFGSFTGTSGNTSGTVTDRYGFWSSYVFEGDYVLIHQTQTTNSLNAGIWELNVVTGGIPSGGGSSTLTLKYPLQNTYTSGCQIIKMPQFSNLTVNNGAVLVQSAWNGTWGGIIALFCNDTVTINGQLSTNDRGYRGGAGRDFGSTSFTGENWANTGLQKVNAENNGGGGSDGDNGASKGASGGGGGNRTLGGAGSTEGGGAQGGEGGNISTTYAECQLVTFGGGGGGGSRTGSGAYPAGGVGGGIIFIFSKNIVLNGLVNSNGQGGQTSGDGGGGGGAGGSILFKAITATLGSSTAAVGAAGGIRGGTGGTGAIHIDYASSYTGTTNPTLSARQDSSLYPAGGSFIYNLI